MYSRALPAKSFGSGANTRSAGFSGQLPYQTNADPTVTRKTQKHRSAKAAGKKRITPDMISEEQVTGTKECSTNSAKTSSSTQNAYAPQTLLTLETLRRVELAFQHIVRKEKLKRAQLLAVFYLNRGEVEAWYLYRSSEANVADSAATENDTGDRQLELTQRRQSILRQYYHNWYQYVILYEDSANTECYRCVGMDVKRKRQELELQRQASTGICSISCEGDNLARIWHRITNSFRSATSNQTAF